VPGHVTQRFLRNAEERQRPVRGQCHRRGRKRQAHRETGRSRDLVGELFERRDEADLLDHRGVQLVRQLPQRHGQVVHFAHDPPQTVGLRRREALVAASELLQLVAEHGQALNGVVVHLPGHPRALGLLGGEEPLCIGAVQGHHAPLRDHHRDAEGADQNAHGEDGGEEDPPEDVGGTGHNTPHVMATNARISLAALALIAR